MSLRKTLCDRHRLRLSLRKALCDRQRAAMSLMKTLCNRHRVFMTEGASHPRWRRVAGPGSSGTLEILGLALRSGPGAPRRCWCRSLPGARAPGIVTGRRRASRLDRHRHRHRQIGDAPGRKMRRAQRLRPPWASLVSSPHARDLTGVDALSAARSTPVSRRPPGKGSRRTLVPRLPSGFWRPARTSLVPDLVSNVRHGLSSSRIAFQSKKASWRASDLRSPRQSTGLRQAIARSPRKSAGHRTSSGPS